MKNLLILAGGTGIAQVLGILFSPIISRMYSPGEFGILGSIMALAGILISISQLRYESALVVEKDDRSANKLQELCIAILCAISILTLLTIFYSPQVFFWLNDNEDIGRYLFFAVPILLFTGLFNVLHFRLNRDEKYKILASAQILKKGGVLFFQLTFGMLGLTAFGLIFGNILGLLLAIFLISFHLNFKIHYPRTLNYWTIAKKHYRFPIYSAPQALIHTISLQLPIIVIGMEYGAAVLGAYYFAVKIVQLPATFIGSAVRSVFYKEAVNKKDKLDVLLSLFRRTTILLIVIIIIPALSLIFFGPQLFSFIFGPEWDLAGLFSRWMILWLGTTFVMSPTRALFFVLEKQKIMLWLDVGLSILRSLLLILSAFYFHLDVISVVALFCILSFIFYTIIIIGWHIFLKLQVVTLHKIEQ